MLAILESAKQTLTSGARLQSDFVLLPKSNLLGSADSAPESAASAPEGLQDWLITEEEFRSTFKVPADTDFPNSSCVMRRPRLPDLGNG